MFNTIPKTWLLPLIKLQIASIKINIPQIKKEIKSNNGQTSKSSYSQIVHTFIDFTS